MSALKKLRDALSNSIVSYHEAAMASIQSLNKRYGKNLRYDYCEDCGSIEDIRTILHHHLCKTCEEAFVTGMKKTWLDSQYPGNTENNQVD